MRRVGTGDQREGHAVNDKAIESVARALLRAAPEGSRVILFGSHARGIARPDSDIDFLVVEPVVEDRFAETYRLRKAIEEVLADELQPVDLVITDEARYRRYEDTPNTLAFEAATEGRVYG